VPLEDLFPAHAYDSCTATKPLAFDVETVKPNDPKKMTTIEFRVLTISS
jgi:hypothetical protein